MMSVSAGAGGTSRVTGMFVATTDGRTMSLVRGSYFSSMSVYRRPNDEPLVTMRGWPCGSGMLHVYAVWVCP